MKLTVVQFLGLFFLALALGPSFAHVLELPHKIGLSESEYLTVQKIYAGWAWLGIVVLGAFVSTLALSIMVRARRAEFVPALIAFLCVVASQAIFWMLTYPANQATSNWTVLPGNWAVLRQQWEFSHAAAAALNLVAFVSVVVAVLEYRK